MSHLPPSFAKFISADGLESIQQIQNIDGHLRVYRRAVFQTPSLSFVLGAAPESLVRFVREYDLYGECVYHVTGARIPVYRERFIQPERKAAPQAEATQRANRLADECGDLRRLLTEESARCRRLERELDALKAKVRR